MKFPIGIQTFEKIITECYAYVDKTALVYQLVTSGSSYCFLSRPRRFGKSLLITTLESYFSGKKDLFKGLAIEKLEKDWIEYPVLHLDLNTGAYNTEDGLKNQLNDTLCEWEQIYGSKPSENELQLRFKGIIQRAYEKTGKRVVILVDEYDKPLISTFDNPYLQNLYRAQLKAFYSVLKTMDGCIKFALLTGVTKFSKVSIFSDLNNLKDISMDDRYVLLCGMTCEEIASTFDEEVGKMSDKHGITKEECYAKLKQMYDGYHFCENTEGIYNPFSVVNALDEKKFKNYWFETGTPTMLVQVMKACKFNLNDLQGKKETANLLGSIDSIDRTPIPLFYQTGYLTIAGYDARYGKYVLDFPNKEVEQSFVNYLADYYQKNPMDSEFAVENFVGDLESGDIQRFMERMQAFFSGNDYRIAGDMELYFQNAVFILMKLIGFYVEAEKATSSGRADLQFKTADNIYIIEIKLNGTAEEAIQQIKEKKYAEPYKLDSRKKTLIGVNFSTEKRTIDNWVIEEAKELI